MHTMWKGSISFGLVNIPVKMYAATEEKDIRFRYLHKECQTPVQNVRMCPHCQKEVPWNEIVKGFEYSEGKFVVMEKEEWDRLLPDPNKAIEILDFAHLSEIDPIYYQKTYYLGAQDANNKAYALLREALSQSKKIAVAKVTIRSKQSLAVIRVYQSCLVMETIFYPDEVRDVKMVPGVPENVELQEKELNMAFQLIENLTTSFDPSKYQDDRRIAMEKIIEQKIENQEVKSPPTKKPEKVIDLMKALQASLEATAPPAKKKTKRTTTKRKKVTS
jgi:DNA end-binding protein Ku